jgi:hypothetical protein
MGPGKDGLCIREPSFLDEGGDGIERIDKVADPQSTGLRHKLMRVLHGQSA